MPSWRYMIDHGASTIWERWDAWTAERGFHSPWMNSFNHCSLGSAGEWPYRFVLGIDLAPGAAGFDQIRVRPHPGGSLTSARGSYRSARGLMTSEWERRDGEFRLRADAPASVRASVRVPSGQASEVRDAAGRPPAGTPFDTFQGPTRHLLSGQKGRR
jgi:alpha-L-rhamnosidase